MTTSNQLFVVDHDTCFGCGACIALCPTNALSLIDLLAEVEQESCTYCMKTTCILNCFFCRVLWMFEGFMGPFLEDRWGYFRWFFIQFCILFEFVFRLLFLLF